ncbi:hypothetical protein IID21_03615 [Patescibacteria group bacterium]|nr:hypothetical protein [Patescibacteria group bacterium]
MGKFRVKKIKLQNSRSKKFLKIFFASVGLIFLISLFYIYKLHALAVNGNEIFAYRCTNVNPPLISYKNSFLVIAGMLSNPENYEPGSGKTAFENYISGMRNYVEEENKWLDMQKTYMDSWDFQLIEPWYIKQAGEYQWKMYEGYRDDATYMLELVDSGGLAEDIDAKIAEARERRDKYEQMYYDFFDQAVEIRDWRKIFSTVPIPEACNEENLTIPNTSGSIDWEGQSEEPTPIPELVDPDTVS